MVSLLPPSFHSSIANVCIEVLPYPLPFFLYLFLYALNYALFLREIKNDLKPFVVLTAQEAHGDCKLCG